MATKAVKRTSTRKRVQRKGTAIEDPRIIREILAHLGLPTEVPHARPPRPPPTGPADLVSNLPA
jgi:hypothetical protein